jgi:hypothetical protein
MTEAFKGPHTSSAFKEMAEAHTILRTEVGSGLHGIAIAGTDDRDEMGICIEPRNYVIGLDKFEQYEFRTQPQGVRSGPGDLDLNIYSLRKWMRLAIHGNPTVLMMLFAPRSALMVCTEDGHQLRTNYEWFVSKQAGYRFQGYMRAQREQMMGLRGGRRRTNRPELIELYGFDTKFASHMIRLGYQGVEFLGTGNITLPMPSSQREQVREIKTGQYSRDECLALAFELEMNLQRLIESAAVPEHPRIDLANQLLISMYQQHWEENS